MSIKELLRKDLMIMSLKAISKDVALDEMIAKLAAHDIIHDSDLLKKSIMVREEQGVTALGHGIAMPHSKHIVVDKPAILFARSSQGIPYQAADGQPVDLFFMVVAPSDAEGVQLEAIADLSKYLAKEGFADRLRQANTEDDILALFDCLLSKEDSAEQVSHAGDFIVAVTACATGLIHTYMAEEALKKAATKKGMTIKVETNGASGVKNALTEDDILRAKGIIIASDKEIDVERFAGKKLVKRPVADGIKHAAELIEALYTDETAAKDSADLSLKGKLKRTFFGK
ncbi:fructose PTS transporter subunit IIA [Streptococcus pluranimalium]|uniref:fructose PTS transporter subunit IIA n=1 Tax=Streptococcus pluranimalium TaxID=82348 RepID=UPI00292FB215|nr:fructose PTS transporter subunit IIA [Streptococcus pluranimalium]MDY3041252.1 fructose PTS transporter subunit IIA [Streptococcus pluranimalium]